MNQYTKIILLLGWGLAVASFSSCCVFPHYVKEENISYNSPKNLNSVDNEFCIFIGGTPSLNTNYAFYQLLDVDSAFLNMRNVKIYHKNKMLKFKAMKYEEKKWKDFNKVLKGESLICFTFKSKLHYGDSIVIVENNFPIMGDSLTTRIIIGTLNQTIQTIENPNIRRVLGNLR